MIQIVYTLQGLVIGEVEEQLSADFMTYVTLKNPCMLIQQQGGNVTFQPLTGHITEGDTLQVAKSNLAFLGLHEPKKAVVEKFREIFGRIQLL